VLQTRRPTRFAAAAASLATLLLSSCGAPALDCDSEAVQRMLSSMVRDRVVQAEIDSVTSWVDAATRSRIEMATSVIVRDTQRAASDPRTGKLACNAALAVEGMGPDNRSIVRTEDNLLYWVTPGDDGAFLIGLSYADLESMLARHFNRSRIGS
jgi:hypothetical protein